MISVWRLGASALSAAACLVFGTGAVAAAPAVQPDLTGVWSGASTPSAPDLTLPYRPEAKAKVDAYLKLVDPVGETPGFYCLGAGMPGAMMGSGGYPMEIIQRPEQITIVYELHGETRRVYFGARNAPQEDRIPGRNGYSSGRWEGDALVVETDNLVDQVDQRYPHSADARIVERYRLGGTDERGRRILQVEATLTDPAYYTRPLTFERRWTEVPNGRLMNYECAEENWHKRLEELTAKAGPPAR